MDMSDLLLPDFSSEPKIITATIEGILEEADLRELLMPSEPNARQQASAAGEASAPSGPPSEFIPTEDPDPTSLKRIREKHHSVARLIANGMTQRLVARITGYTEGYLSVLLNAPAMAELVQFYRVQKGAAAEVISERLKTVGMKALDQLEDKMETEGLSAFELTGIAKLGLDRAGHGPASKNHTVVEHHLVDHAELKRRNQEALSRSAEVIIPMSQVRQALPSPSDHSATDTASEGVADAGA